MYSRHAVLRFYRNIMEYASQDYRDLRWNIGACNNQTGRSDESMCHLFLAGVIQMLMCFVHWNRVFLWEEEYRWNTQAKITVTCAETSVPVIIKLDDPTGVCVTFSWPASSRCWCVSFTGTESSCGRKIIAECRLRPVRTPVSKFPIIAALER